MATTSQMHVSELCEAVYSFNDNPYVYVGVFNGTNIIYIVSLASMKSINWLELLTSIVSVNNTFSSATEDRSPAP